jgi:DNA polymerase III epsilon subunit-like protein
MVVDVETDGYGGFRSPKQRMVQMAYICGGRELSGYMWGVRRVQPVAQSLHGITAEACADGHDFERVFEDFLQKLETCDALAAHNADFDAGCLCHELE